MYKCAELRQETCSKCGRVHYIPTRAARPWCGAYVVITHEGYGCDTGCCGHRVTLFDEHDQEVDNEFDFGHPWEHETLDEYCRGLVEEYFPGLPLHLEDCTMSAH